jgi:phosphoribosylaminoimidazole-succinocarboxamide synthase
VVPPEEREQVAGRAVVVKRLKALPVEAIVRGYLVGSGWADYQKTGKVCGIPLPAGLKQADRLPEPVVHALDQGGVGAHDENIDFTLPVLARRRYRRARCGMRPSPLYKAAAEYALTRGIIIADTKFEFGLDAERHPDPDRRGADPDSSRFWPPTNTGSARIRPATTSNTCATG